MIFSTEDSAHETSATASLSSSLRCLSVIMPVYNEALTIRHILKKVRDIPIPKEIIVVDDCSTDGTRDILKAFIQETEKEGTRSWSNIKLVFHEINQGKGAAIRTGISLTSGDITLIQDADLEYDPNEYRKLIEPIMSGDADVVYGSRFTSERRRVLFFWHMVGNTFLTYLSNICTNLNLSDMETCYKVFKTEILKGIPIRSNRFGFEPEITAKVAKLRLNVYEVPISYRGRGYEEGKKITWKDGFSALWTILKFWLIDDLYVEQSNLRGLQVMEGAGLYNRWLFDQCQPYIGDRVLEVGSGIGNLTKYLLDRELVLATDVVVFYLRHLTRTYRDFENVKVGKLDLLDEDQVKELRKTYQPDSVLCVNVLEHIKEDGSALQNLGRLLPSKGHLVLVVPAHPTLFSGMDKYLGHQTRYTKSVLEQKLDQAGFRVQKMRSVNMLGALGWYVNGKVFRRKLIPSRQVRMFDWLIKILSLEKYINPPFGLSLLVVAEKCDS